MLYTQHNTLNNANKNGAKKMGRLLTFVSILPVIFMLSCKASNVKSSGSGVASSSSQLQLKVATANLQAHAHQNSQSKYASEFNSSGMDIISIQEGGDGNLAGKISSLVSQKYHYIAGPAGLALFISKKFSLKGGAVRTAYARQLRKGERRNGQQVGWGDRYYLCQEVNTKPSFFACSTHLDMHGIGIELGQHSQLANYLKGKNFIVGADFNAYVDGAVRSAFINIKGRKVAGHSSKWNIDGVFASSSFSVIESSRIWKRHDTGFSDHSWFYGRVSLNASNSSNSGASQIVVGNQPKPTYDADGWDSTCADYMRNALTKHSRDSEKVKGMRWNTSPVSWEQCVKAYQSGHGKYTGQSNDTSVVPNLDYAPENPVDSDGNTPSVKPTDPGLSESNNSQSSSGEIKWHSSCQNYMIKALDGKYPYSSEVEGMRWNTSPVSWRSCVESYQQQKSQQLLKDSNWPSYCKSYMILAIQNYDRTSQEVEGMKWNKEPDSWYQCVDFYQKNGRP